MHSNLAYSLTAFRRFFTPFRMTRDKNERCNSIRFVILRNEESSAIYIVAMHILLGIFRRFFTPFRMTKKDNALF